MATQPIEHKGYNYAQPQTKKAREDVDFPLGGEQSKTRHNEVAEQACTACDQIDLLLREIPKNGSNKLSFQDVVSHRDSLEQQWDRQVRSDLFGVGVDLSSSFRLVYDPSTGSVTASSDHPDKLRIDQYFISNQDRADDFRKRLSLDKLVDVAERSLSEADMSRPIDEESMTNWFQNNMETASLFSGGGIVFGMGQSTYKGLDIRV